MLSATTADSRLSIAPRRVNASAAGKSSCTLSSDSIGRCGAGIACGMPPKRLPIVSTGNPTSQTTREARPTVIRKAGQCGLKRRTVRMAAIASTETARAAAFTVGSAAASAWSFGTIGPGSPLGKVRPSSSLSWLAKMITAIPDVNPTVTG
jgi:hypothetical protein